MQLPRQRRVGSGRSLRQHGDPGEIGRRPGRGHDRTTFTLDHERARFQLVVRPDGVGDALTGQCRGVEQQTVALDARHVRRHPVSLGEHHQVAGHDVGGIDQQRCAVAHDGHLAGKEVPQLLGRLLGSVLLRECEQPVDDDHHEDRHTQLGQTTDDGEGPCRPQHRCEEMRQLVDQAPPHRRARGVGQHVGADVGEPMRRVGRCQPVRRGNLWHNSNLRALPPPVPGHDGLRTGCAIRGACRWRRGGRRRCRARGTAGTRR